MATKKMYKGVHELPGLEDKTMRGVVEYLKKHPYLQTCTLKKLGGKNGTGTLIWARNQGSVYWPGLIATLEDKPGVEHDPADPITALAPTDYRCVMFLEPMFRYSLLEWKDIILADENNIDEQGELITFYNKLVIKKKWKEPKQYKDAVILLKEFLNLTPDKRQDHAFQLSIERKKSKNLDKVIQSNKSDSGSVILSIRSSTDGSFTGAGSSNSIASLEDKAKQRSSERYSLRQLNASPVASTISISSSTISVRSNAPNTTSRSSTPDGKSSEDGSERSLTLSEKSAKTKTRPKTGGPAMKEFVDNRFISLDKTFKFESKPTWKCATCVKTIEPGAQVMCHDLPHHKACLITVKKDMKDGTVQTVMKCKCCVEEACSLCKNKTKLDGENKELAVKCSKCDLRYHRSCLTAWPQAIVQGSTGPITCPVHFCHTCMAENYSLRKVRMFKVFSGGKFRCLLCPATYHKTFCLPAGSGEDITGRDFIICPRHTLPNLKISQRRFGCLTCGRNLKTRDETKVECQLCLQIFHAECIGYTNEHRENGISVKDFGAGYKCSLCVWGLFPLYGQVIWYQQSGHSFWPARILYPKEAAGRAEFCKSRSAGEYSIKYFGPIPTFWDKASRTFSLSLATVKILTTMKVYQETDKIKSAYDEAVYFAENTDRLRDDILPQPEPFYKKIDRNIYRLSQGTTKKKQDGQLLCYCADKEDATEVCTPNSGCHNRDTAVECNNNNCKGGDKCQNRMFSQKKKDSDNTEEFLSQGKGWAVKARKDFKDGEFIIEYCGEIISNAEMQYRANRKTEEDPLYLLEIDKHTFIDAEYCGNVSRLINHSCEPNCRTEKYTSEGKPVVGVFAQQDIEKGEELTFDYAYGNESSAPFRCHCGTESCRGFIGKAVTSSTDLEMETPNPDLEIYDKECSKCSFGGHVLCCDYENCLKVYHKTCAGLLKVPDHNQLWFCPDHPVPKVLPKKTKKRKSTKPNHPDGPSKKKILQQQENLEDDVYRTKG